MEFNHFRLIHVYIAHSVTFSSFAIIIVTIQDSHELRKLFQHGNKLFFIHTKNTEKKVEIIRKKQKKQKMFNEIFLFMEMINDSMFLTITILLFQWKILTFPPRFLCIFFIQFLNTLYYFFTKRMSENKRKWKISDFSETSTSFALVSQFFSSSYSSFLFLFIVIFHQPNFIC